MKDKKQICQTIQRKHMLKSLAEADDIIVWSSSFSREFCKLFKLDCKELVMHVKPKSSESLFFARLVLKKTCTAVSRWKLEESCYEDSMKVPIKQILFSKTFKGRHGIEVEKEIELPIYAFFDSLKHVLSGSSEFADALDSSLQTRFMKAIELASIGIKI